MCSKELHMTLTVEVKVGEGRYEDVGHDVECQAPKHKHLCHRWRRKDHYFSCNHRKRIKGHLIL